MQASAPRRVRRVPLLLVAVAALLTACTSVVGGVAQRAGDGVGAAPTAGLSSAPVRPNPPTSSRTDTLPSTPFPVPPSTPGRQSSAVDSSTDGGPTSDGRTTENAQWTFVVVRHAERADDGTDDPPLTEAGTQRANRLAGLLAPLRGVAVYASPYQRTQATGTPTSVAWGVPVTTYDPTQDEYTLLSQMISDHPSGAILIVGHSDTVPSIVQTLCECAVDPISEDDFGELYRVALDDDGTVLDFTTQQGY